MSLYTHLQCADREWLDAINAERRKEQLDQVPYETFEIIMDRLEKEWFELVSTKESIGPYLVSHILSDEAGAETRQRAPLRGFHLCHM